MPPSHGLIRNMWGIRESNTLRLQIYKSFICTNSWIEDCCGVNVNISVESDDIGEREYVSGVRYVPRQSSAAPISAGSLPCEFNTNNVATPMWAKVIEPPTTPSNVATPMYRIAWLEVTTLRKQGNGREEAK